ncbi:MAG TPA: DUF6042 family protein [Actinomycetota bacterium]|jgi:hypothetical protein|nr:DUF6042 family protein [Actinomycetota bacterium]
MQSVDAGIREAIEEYIRTGWSLILPPGAILLLGAVAQLEARQQIGNFTAALPLAMQAGALAAPAWEPLSDADRADEATMALRRRHEAVTWRIAGQVHLLPPRTQGEVVDLMLKLGLIQRVGDGASVQWKIVRPLPRPEVVILPDSDRQPRRDEI